MSGELPLVSIVIPTRPGQATIPAVEAARALDYPPERLEILVARGCQPAVQRNAALRAAQGELIYFLDDDAKPQPRNLRRALGHFASPEVKVVGGPNVCPPEAPPLEQVFAVVLASVLAFGPSRARYEAVGTARASSEKELILCNLAARRDALLALGGFDESLYPNEENALMDDLQKAGAQLIYDPEFVAYRRPRPTLQAFLKMLLTYGRGRAEQFRLHPTPGSALNFVPPLFVLYLALWPLLHMTAIHFAWTGLRPEVIHALMDLPLGLYAMALVCQAALSARQYGVVRSLAALPLVAATHLLYGLGFWRGLCTRLGRPGAQPASQVALDRMPVRTRS